MGEGEVIIIIMKEKIIASGHKNVLSLHKNTIEITKDDYLTRKGDCIIGINADKGLNDISDEFKIKLKKEREIEIIFSCGGISDKVVAYGHPDLILTHPHDIVIRKSDFIDERTLVIKADKSAIDLDKTLVEMLKNSNSELIVEIKI